ncbi:hypothetical protein STEG23_021736 [Scotinomys teguina]
MLQWTTLHPTRVLEQRRLDLMLLKMEKRGHKAEWLEKGVDSGISYFELESSGPREEIRYHYIHRGKPRTEALPYRMADGQWHKVALSVSASHLLLHVDCNRTLDSSMTEHSLDHGTSLMGQQGLYIPVRNLLFSSCTPMDLNMPLVSRGLSGIERKERLETGLER